MDPNAFVAPAAPLQQMAWQNAGSLGDWRGQSATASQFALGAGQGGANLAGPGGAMGRYAGAAGLTPAAQMSGGGPAQLPASALGGSAQTAASALGGDKAMRSSNLPRPRSNAFSGANSGQPAGAFNPGGQQQGPAWQASASGYSAPQLGNAALVSGQGYSAPQLGNARTYAAPRIGAPIGAEAATYQAPAAGAAQTAAASGYNPNQAAGTTIDPAANAGASDAGAASLLDNLSAYQNPYQQRVVNAALADYDNQAAQQRAALEARGAATGAFGGSRFGIAQGQLEGDLARGRATLESGLLDQGFNAAAGLSQSDAANRQQAGLANAQNRTGVSLANAGAANARDLAQAQLAQAGNIFNADAANSAGQFGAAAHNQADMVNATAANSRADLAAQLAAQAGQFNAGALNANSQFNAGQANQAAAAQAGLDSAAGQFGAEQGNAFALQQAALLANAGQFNAGAQNQAGLANQAAQNQYGLAQADLSQAAGQFDAGAQNQASQFNAGANNQMSQFNASQQDAALARQLQAAGMLGGLASDYGSGTRADLGTMAQLGDQQRAIEQAYAMAGPAQLQLQLMGQLSGMTPYQILVGQNVNTSTAGQTTGTGTQVTAQSPSLFSQLLAAGQLASSFIPK